MSMPWNTRASLPYDPSVEFEVKAYGHVRRVRRVGMNSTFLTPGTLAFVDCKHPSQNVICAEADVEGWRYAEASQALSAYFLSESN